MLPIGGVLGIHLVLLAYTLYEPSLWRAIWSDLSWSALSPAADEAIKHSIMIGIPMGVWMGWEIWKRWIKKDRNIDERTREQLLKLQFPPELERKRLPAFAVLVGFTLLALSAEVLRRIDLSLWWLALIAAVIASVWAYWTLTKEKVPGSK